MFVSEKEKVIGIRARDVCGDDLIKWEMGVWVHIVRIKVVCVWERIRPFENYWETV